MLPVGLLAVGGAIQIAAGRAERRARPFLVSLVLFLLVVAFVHWESRYVLYLGVGCAGLAGHAIVTLGEEARRRRGLTSRQARALFALLVLAVLAPALVRTPLRVSEMLQRQPVELLVAAEKLRSLSGPGARIMGRKPHLAYLAGGEWVFLPEVASIDALEEALCRRPVTYLVYDDSARKLRRELSPLGDPNSSVPWLRAVHVDPAAPLIVYAVALDGRCSAAAQDGVPRP